MKPTPSPLIETTNFALVRSETALRYPIHNLSTNEDTIILIQKRNEKNTIVFLWEVNQGRKGSLPGRLAYQVDTLIVKRRIDETTYGGQSVPKVLRLGTLQEMAEELGLRRNTNAVRKALHENASAYLKVKGLTYQSSERGEANEKLEYPFEFGDTRYGVVFTNQKLPDGTKADAVFLVFHDLYLALLNRATRRPLDYDYLRALSPSEQRFYEILSYQMVPAIRYKQRARLAYSEFCLLSTMTRYETYEQVKKQMWKIHTPHKQAGYIEQVDFEPTTDDEGRPDWNILYVPGERAKNQQLVFDLRVPQRRCSAPTIPLPPSLPAPTGAKPTAPFAQLSLQTIEAPVIETPEARAAHALVRKFYQLRYGQAHTPTEKEATQAAGLLAGGEAWANYLVEAAARRGQETNGFPNDFGGVEKLTPQFKSGFTAGAKKARAARREEARQGHQEAHRGAYHRYLGQLLGEASTTPFTEALSAFAAKEEAMLRYHKARAAKSSLSASMVAEYDTPANRLARLAAFIAENPKSGLPGFWTWDKTLNPQPFAEKDA